MKLGVPFAIVSLVLALAGNTADAADCATPGSDGSGSFSGIVNTYWGGVSNPSAGATSFTLGPATGASTSITPGSLLLLIQMQDANINRNNTGAYGDGAAADPASGYTNIRRAGRYEFVRATNTVPTTGGTLNISSGIIYDYTNSAANANRGRRTFQIVRVPQYTDLTLTGTLTASAWNGATGGVVAVDVAGTLDFNNAGINVSGLGFRGGGAQNSTTGSGANTDYRTPTTNGANGSKGEGIAGTPRYVIEGTTVIDNVTEGYPNGSRGRGAPANGGGGGTDGNPALNDQNTGAGGGGGYGDGGRGGHAWCPGGPAVCSQSGGFGGSGVGVQGVSRLTMGGGGGAGTTNNSTGTPGGGVASSGAPGGGIIIVRAGTITGTGALSANGAQANQTVGNDGSGGGGGGGTILISADSIAGASLSASALGGGGGTNGNSSPHGPGGGGGGGLVSYTSNLAGVASVVTGGAPGTTDGNTAPFNVNYGSTAGAGGTTAIVSAPNVPGFSSGQECSVEIAKSFTPSSIAANAPSRLTLTLTNPNPDLPMTALSVTDTYPANVENAPVPNTANTCGGSVTATAAGTTLDLTGASLASGASCTVEVDVVSGVAGDHVNTVTAGNATAAINGQPVSNLLPASDTLTITLPLTANKSVAILSDPIYGTTNPYALPGAVAEYTISFTNPGTVAVDAGTIAITDAVPANTVFSNENISGGLPIVFDDGSPSSGLSLSAAGLEFSNDGGATFTYTPSGVRDPAVTHVRVTPSGTMAPGTSGAIRFRVELD